MRLVTFASGSSETVGLHVGPMGAGKIIDVAVAAPAIGAPVPNDMMSVIRSADTFLPGLKRVLEAYESKKLPEAAILDETKTKLLSPIPRPTSMRDGYAFRQHVETARRNRGVPMIPEFDQFPIFYFTNHLAVTGPGDLTV